MENKIIKELKNITTTITIKEKWDEIDSKIFWICNVFLFIIAFLVLIYFCGEPKVLSSSSDKLQDILELILFLSLFTFIESMIIKIAIKFNKSKRIEKNKDKINQLEEYMAYSENELIKLKEKKIKELINLSLDDYKLFHFILFKIDNEKLEKDFISYIDYNNDILEEVCENPHLLSIINELPTNEDTEYLRMSIQEYLEEKRIKERRGKRKRKKFKNSINKKMKHEIKVI